jgi:peptidoglycan hydrolase CwlO-like protein
MKFAVKQNKIAVFCFITALFSLLFLAAVFSIKAADDQDETQKKIEELEKKAEVYREIIDLKQKQQQSLSNQVEIIETESKKIESEIELNKKKIEELNSQISKLEEWIKENNRALEGQKKILAGLLQVQYENKNDVIFQNFFNNGDGIFNLVIKEDRVKQVGEKISEIIKIIQSTKDNLTKEKEDLENKKRKIIELYYEQEERVTQLEAVKNQKEVLITQTQGEEGKYQQLLAKIEQQKAELLNIDELGVGLSADDYEKPSSKYHASTSWYYSQRDSRWASKIIASNATISQYGCALTSVAMIMKYNGLSITPITMLDPKVASYTNNALIYWPSNIQGVKLNTDIGTYHGNISSSNLSAKIDPFLKNDTPVIVRLQKTNTSGAHYVVVHTKTNDGKYIVHDPYWGSNIYLDTSKSLVGRLNPSGGVYVNQMIVYSKK